MPKPTLLYGAKRFLAVVFAHQNRMRLNQIESFRRVLLDDDLRAEPHKDGARFVLGRNDWNRGDWTQT